MPEFPGGEAGVIDYFRNGFISLQSVVEAAGDQTQLMIVDLLIDKNGAVQVVNIYESSLYQADKEIRRLCENMPLWKPAYKKGESVGSWVVLTYNYKIKDRFWEPVYNGTKVLVTKNKKETNLMKASLVCVASMVMYAFWGY